MNNAIIAGTFPTPKIGIINAKSAREGIVCNALVTVITIFAAFLKRVKKLLAAQQLKFPILKQKRRYKYAQNFYLKFLNHALQKNQPCSTPPLLQIQSLHLIEASSPHKTS